MSRRSTVVFALGAIFLASMVAAAIALLAFAPSTPSSSGQAAVTVSSARKAMAPPFVMFRTLAPRYAFGRVAMVAPGQPLRRRLTPLSCARVHYAGGIGVCLVEEPKGKVVHQ